MISRVWDVTFTVSGLERAVDFYGRTLGLQEVPVLQLCGL